MAYAYIMVLRAYLARIIPVLILYPVWATRSLTVNALKPNDVSVLNGFYDGRYRFYGHDPRSLGWIVGTQQIRFKQLTSIGDINGCSILDVGCGFGDLYGYLLAKGIRVEYTGIDLNPIFIKIAKKVYPDANFIVGDFEDERFTDMFDWSFESGIFNLKIEDNDAFIRNTLKKMFYLSKKGLAADFLNSRTMIKDRSMYYQNPEDLKYFCHSLSDYVILKSGYRPAEFCVYIYKG
jgi:SAM-dependent methyltransferase